jgi:hypothetical protein
MGFMIVMGYEIIFGELMQYIQFKLGIIGQVFHNREEI